MRGHSFIRASGLFFFDLVKIILISLAIVLPVRYFLVQPFYVKGASMEPNFYDHEYLIINEITYRFNNPQRGEIIVFRYPRDPRQFFIKRVIGLPNETVMIRGGTVYIREPNQTIFHKLNEPYLEPDTFSPGELEMTIGSHEYFVLGDNRQNSYDSHEFGPVDRSLIVGQVWVRGWPLNRFVVFHAPDYHFK